MTTKAKDKTIELDFSKSDGDLRKDIAENLGFDASYDVEFGQFYSFDGIQINLKRKFSRPYSVCSGDRQTTQLTIRFQFLNVSSEWTYRALTVKAEHAVSLKKLKAKFDEVAAMKRSDDERATAQQKRRQEEKDSIATLRAECEALHIDIDYYSPKATVDEKGVSVLFNELTPLQARQLWDVYESFEGEER